MSLFIRIYTVCHSVPGLQLSSFLAPVDVSNYRDRIIYCSNSGLKGSIQKQPTSSQTAEKYPGYITYFIHSYLRE